MTVARLMFVYPAGMTFAAALLHHVLATMAAPDRDAGFVSDLDLWLTGVAWFVAAAAIVTVAVAAWEWVDARGPQPQSG